MEIKELFVLYEKQINHHLNSKNIFEESGLLNIYKILDYGFFPLGSGILNSESEIENAKINTNGIMILGNDFGTLSYLENKCNGNKESKNNKTIWNLLDLGLDMNQTFFTNFFLGLRNDKEIEGTSNTKRIRKISDDYKSICIAFFKTQLDFIKPKMIICLGDDVRKILFEQSNSTAEIFNPKISIMNLYSYEDKKYSDKINFYNFGEKKIIVIPHPSYAHVNWTKYNIKEKIKNEVNNF